MTRSKSDFSSTSGGWRVAGGGWRVAGGGGGGGWGLTSQQATMMKALYQGSWIERRGGGVEGHSAGGPATTMQQNSASSSGSAFGDGRCDVNSGGTPISVLGRCGERGAMSPREPHQKAVQATDRIRIAHVDAILVKGQA